MSTTALKNTMSLRMSVRSLWKLSTSSINKHNACCTVAARCTMSSVVLSRHDNDEPKVDVGLAPRQKMSPTPVVTVKQDIKLQSPVPTPSWKGERLDTVENTDRTLIDDDSTTTTLFVSPSELRYTGDAVIPITSHLHIVRPDEDTPRGIWPVFRLLVSIPTSNKRNNEEEDSWRMFPND